jgi:NAD(P)-dependent dehydrogenase (short-subunit alcohol dehydrogenase family)
MLAVTVLRDGLLEGRAIAIAGGAPEEVREALESLGARVETLPADGVLAGDEERVGDWARGVAPLDALVYDARQTFGAGGTEALTEALERGWVAVREVANGALIPAGGSGKVLLLGPRPDAGPHAEAARAALENLARTLSVEWARHGVTAAMVAPGRLTSDDDLAELVCFLVSPAGEYFSGCRLELGATA